VALSTEARIQTVKYRAICENHLYSKAYAKGKRYITRDLRVYVLPDYHAERLRRANPTKKRINRIGLTVSKKVGGAVVRSRVKRIIREAYRSTDKTHGVKTGFLIVIAARESAAQRKSTELIPQLEKALGALGLIKVS
jgi:ribonuclease P protein component